MERYKDIIGGLFWMIVAAMMYQASFSIKTLAIGAGSSAFVGSGFMPRLVAIGMIIFSMIITWQGIQRLRVSNGDACVKTELSFREQYLPVIASLILLIFYIALMEQVGFIGMTAVYLFGQMFILASSDHRKPVMFLVISIACAAVIYYTFVEVFYLMLPESRIF